MVTGFVTLILFFADPPPGGEEAQFSIAFMLAALAGFLFGMAVARPRWSLMGAIAGWGPALLGLPFFISGIIQGDLTSDPVEALGTFGLMFGPAALGAAGGMLGSLIGRRLAPEPPHSDGGVSPIPPPVIGTNRTGISSSDTRP